MNLLGMSSIVFLGLLAQLCKSGAPNEFDCDGKSCLELCARSWSESPDIFHLDQLVEGIYFVKDQTLARSSSFKRTYVHTGRQTDRHIYVQYTHIYYIYIYREKYTCPSIPPSLSLNSSEFLHNVTY